MEPSSPVGPIVIPPPLPDPSDSEDPFVGLSRQEIEFVQGWIRTGSPGKAAREAGYSSPAGAMLLRKPLIRACLFRLRAIDPDLGVARVEEARSILTEIARDTEAKNSDRIRASEILLKTQGALGPEVYVDARTQNAAVTYVIGTGAPSAVLDACEVLRQVIAGETVDTALAVRTLEGLIGKAPPALAADVEGD